MNTPCFPSASNHAALPGIRWGGPERRGEMARMLGHTCRMLDAIEDGIALLDDGARVVHLNIAGRRRLSANHALRLDADGHLRGRDPGLQARWADAITASARREAHRMLALRCAGRLWPVTVQPLGLRDGAGHAMVVALLGRGPVCSDLALRALAAECRLTAAEEAVLRDLRDGLEPSQVARTHDVKLSTVRTQIGAIRTKTGATSIRALLHMLATLPPMVGALRGAVETLDRPDAVNDATALQA